MVVVINRVEPVIDGSVSKAAYSFTEVESVFYDFELNAVCAAGRSEVLLSPISSEEWRRAVDFWGDRIRGVTLDLTHIRPFLSRNAVMKLQRRLYSHETKEDADSLENKCLHMIQKSFPSQFAAPDSEEASE